MTRRDRSLPSIKSVLEILGYKKTLEGWISPYDKKKRSQSACWAQELKRLQPCGHANTNIIVGGGCGACADNARKSGIETGEAFYG